MASLIHVTDKIKGELVDDEVDDLVSRSRSLHLLMGACCEQGLYASYVADITPWDLHGTSP